MTNSNLYKSGGRRFNDLWALILYIIVVSGTIIGCLVSSKTETGMGDISLFKMPSVIQILTVLALAFSTVVIIVLGFLYIPVFLMHASFLIMPVASIAIPIFLNAHGSVIIASIVGGIIGLLFYFFVARKNIKFSAKVAQASTQIILQYMAVVILMITIFISIAITLECCYLVAAKNSAEFAAGNGILGTALFFSLTWTMFSLIYFMRVFISSVVCLEILTYSHVSSILMESISNTFYALGSIMFGAMLIAIVQTLRMLVSRDEERSDSILNSILYFLLCMLEDVIRFANEWVFVHIALYGKSYVKTLKTSFQELMSGKGSILVNSLCIMSAINLLSFACGLLYLGILYLTIDLAKVMKDIKEIMMLIMIILTLFMFLDNIGMVFDSASKAFLLCYNRSPEAIKEKFPEAYDALQEQERKNVVF